jgi:hypothetical protein
VRGAMVTLGEGELREPAGERADLQRRAPVPSLHGAAEGQPLLQVAASLAGISRLAIGSAALPTTLCRDSLREMASGDGGSSRSSSSARVPAPMARWSMPVWTATTAARPWARAAASRVPRASASAAARS